ncbi:MAG: hypothetical protein H6727_18690 [Myxococcales bacterium]|nr:hypothetical protein [Myxococcales bacterium]
MLSSTSSSDPNLATSTTPRSEATSGADLSTVEVTPSEPDLHEEMLAPPNSSVPQSEWDASEPVSPLISSGSITTQRTAPKAVEPPKPKAPQTRTEAWRLYAPDIIGWVTFFVFFVLPWLLLCGVSFQQLGVGRGALIALPLPSFSILSFEIWFRLGKGLKTGPSPDFFVAIASLLGLFVSFLLFSSFMP